MPAGLPDTSESTAEDEEIAALDAEVEAPVPPPIIEVPEPIDVGVPVEAAAVEQPQVDVPEPELLQDRIENIDESIDPLTVDDLSD